MKFFSNRASRSMKREHGFTMIEIALCLAIVGFSMVVIMGVLPLGGQVQVSGLAERLQHIDLFRVEHFTVYPGELRPFHRKLDLIARGYALPQFI